MIESDCKIPITYQPIEQPETYQLHGIPLAVKQMLDKGAKRWQIHAKLRISDDDYRDAIFEIRKKEAIETMRGRRTNPEKRTRVIALREQGMTYREIAEECGITVKTVQRIAESAGLTQKRERATQINQEFEDAVNEMIAQADEPTAEPVTACTVPKAVLDAVKERIELIESCIEQDLCNIRQMQQGIENYRTEIAELKAWAEANGYESTEA